MRMGLRLFVPFFIIIGSVVWLIASLMLPKAPLGDPNGPMYFPLVLSIFLLVMGVIHFIQEWKIRHQEKGVLKALKSGRSIKLIALTLVFCLIYTFIFERIGFLISTILFLIALLSLVNGIKGWKKWVTNLTVAVIFSFVMWYGFSQLLEISLP